MFCVSFNFTFKKFKRLCLSFALSLFFICFYIFLFVFAFAPKLKLTVKANTYTTYIYAQITSSNTYFYTSTSSTSPSNAYFILPQSYCVLLLSNINESFYKAQYRDMVGYVLKSSVVPIKEVPTTPYLENISFRVYSSDGINMFASPLNTSSGKIIEQVSTLEFLDYYGEIEGDEFISNRGLTWVYAKNNKTQNKGYFYKGLCDNFSFIPKNTQTLTPLSSTPFENNDNTYLYSLISLSPPLKALLITLVCLPALVIIYLLFKPLKNISLPKSNKLNNLNNKKHPPHTSYPKLNNNLKYKNSNLNSNHNNCNNNSNYKNCFNNNTNKKNLNTKKTKSNFNLFETIKNFFGFNKNNKTSSNKNSSPQSSHNKHNGKSAKNIGSQTNKTFNKTTNKTYNKNTINKIKTIIDDELL